MAKKSEKRKHTICPNCRHEMVCMNKFESIYNLIRGFLSGIFAQDVRVKPVVAILFYWRFHPRQNV